MIALWTCICRSFITTDTVSRGKASSAKFCIVPRSVQIHVHGPKAKLQAPEETGCTWRQLSQTSCESLSDSSSRRTIRLLESALLHEFFPGAVTDVEVGTIFIEDLL